MEHTRLVVRKSFRPESIACKNCVVCVNFAFNDRPARQVARFKAAVSYLIIADYFRGRHDVFSHVAVRNVRCAFIIGNETVAGYQAPVGSCSIHHANLDVSAFFNTASVQVRFVTYHIRQIASSIERCRTFVVKKAVAKACKFFVRFRVQNRDVTKRRITAATHTEGNRTDTAKGERATCKRTRAAFVIDTRKQVSTLLIVGELLSPPADIARNDADITRKRPARQIARFKRTVEYLVGTVGRNIVRIYVRFKCNRRIIDGFFFPVRLYAVQNHTADFGGACVCVHRFNIHSLA